MKYRLKKGSEVVVISGAHRGERGRVLEVLRDTCRVVIEGVALRKRRIRKDQNHPEGGVVEREDSIHYSNVMLLERFNAKRG